MSDTCAIRALTLMVLLTVSAAAGGCAKYAVPRHPADMARFGLATDQQREEGTDYQIRRRLALKPLARFPANVAVAHVQGTGYAACGVNTYGRGAYAVVLTREAETDEQLARVAAWPMIDQVGPINRIMLPATLESDRDLRTAAAAMHADMLLIYTFDTNIYLGDSGSPLDVVTLGFLPHKKPRVTTTASAVLLDTRNGYLYGGAEATATRTKFANTWTNEQAVDTARRQTEAEALDKLVTELTDVWPQIVSAYAQPGSS